MTVLFEGDVSVHYGFVYVDSGVGGWVEEVDQRAGQRNGLLGAAQPGFLLISTGMHTGLVPFRVEEFATRPPVDDTYDEIVEASCDLRGPELSMSTFEWATSFAVPQGGPHRVRLSARHFEAGREQERYDPSEPVRDSYLLQLWPAAMAPDEIVTGISEYAAYWHRVAQEQPTGPPSPHDQGLDEQRRRNDAAARQRAIQRAEYLDTWGGREPTPRLLEVEQQAITLSRHRRDLVDSIAALPADRQRGLAVELAHRACDADDGPLDWLPAVDALDAGRSLPAPFDDAHAVIRELFPAPAHVVASQGWSSMFEPTPRVPLHTGVTASFTVRAAAASDPLAAALAAVNAASWSAPDIDAYFADIAAEVADG